MKTRRCKHCKEIKLFEDFPISQKKREGVLRRHACAKCYYQNNNKVNYNRTRIWYEELKKTCKCNRCGDSDFRVLEFHHSDPTLKRDNVSALAHRCLSKESVLKEIEKCECLCVRCHRIEEYERRQLKKRSINSVG